MGSLEDTPNLPIRFRELYYGPSSIRELCTNDDHNNNCIKFFSLSSNNNISHFTVIPLPILRIFISKTCLRYVVKLRSFKFHLFTSFNTTLSLPFFLFFLFFCQRVILRSVIDERMVFTTPPIYHRDNNVLNHVNHFSVDLLILQYKISSCPTHGLRC